MKKLLIPILLMIAGLAAGGGAGFYLRPQTSDAMEEEARPKAAEPDLTQVEYVALSNQFVIPVLEGGRIVSVVATSLSIEVPTGKSDIVRAREPRLQDAFLRVLFDHANSGGFRGSFTDSTNLLPLRRALVEQARQVLDDVASDVLITEIVRQDNQ
ncbi:flagellar basal body-associated FliL family protein [Xinfangfangia sp. D13-10-4-6]|uniref:flagellar basal body-associated FliL family protein n=1 Tax=Pseudogemmobacter hezensis TaxID=2737662 RepID=UPI0015525C85|nr:flagellar basal body-associated FliL family protein [Pseudogemmobacter hezensis]NPD16950.1 flagellar basal body-associated FliL family protein [Pseudogemmobacter hezensis]